MKCREQQELWAFIFTFGLTNVSGDCLLVVSPEMRPWSCKEYQIQEARLNGEGGYSQNFSSRLLISKMSFTTICGFNGDVQLILESYQVIIGLTISTDVHFASVMVS